MATQKELMTAMTMNVQTYDVTEARRVNLPIMVRKYMPDLLGLQEASSQWMRILKEALPEYDFVGLGRNAHFGGDRSAIFFRKDKFTLIESDTKWLSETPDVPGTKFKDSSHLRVATYAVLRRNSDGKEILHINTHLDGSSMNMKQIAVMLDIIKDKPYPVLMTGDFNMRRHEPNYQMVLDAGYVDAASVAKEINWTAVVDYLFLKAPDVEVPKFRTCDELINGVRVSDHEPAYIEFLL